ncbi:MAG: hypothetical protein OXF61_10610 [Acidimicrobiaceae bacterium]|nr:hypothetical protein [Acidimicrobiaceae bacterium]
MLGLAVAAAGVLALPGHASAQATGTDGYAACEAGQSIDVLVMMDASGSLNAPSSGVDSDGSLRTDALRRFRGDLSALLAELPAGSSASVRLALWRFESDVVEIAGFAAPGADHPSDAHIARSLGERAGAGLSYRTSHTDYLDALRAAEAAFADYGRRDACRLLLFFTDGLHDPIGSMTLAQADELRDDVCNDIKRAYERQGIETYAILLGLGNAETGTDPVRDEMSVASKQILRALTGHATSRLVRGLPYANGFDCRRWSDEQPGDRTGSILAIDDLGDLALQLLEVVDVAASGLSEWTNCGVGTGTGRRSAPMPAGSFIEQIVAYPRGAAITGYEIVAAEGERLAGRTSGSAPVRLDASDFGHLAAGWTLEFTTEGNGDVDIACFIRRAAPERAESTGVVTDDAGQEVEAVERSAQGEASPPLHLEVSAEAPQGLCEAAHFDWPDERVRDWACRDGRVVFDLVPLECQQVLRLDPLAAAFEPRNAEAVPGLDSVAAEVRIDIDGPSQVVYDCFGGPALACDADADGAHRVEVRPDTDELPRVPLSGHTRCVLFPPERGAVEVRAQWQPDTERALLPGDLEWRFDADHHDGGDRGTVEASGSVLRLPAEASAAGVELRFVTADELDNGDWGIRGTISLEPTWDIGESDVDAAAVAIRAADRQSERLQVDHGYAGRSNSAATFWLTLLLLIASLAASYLLFCAALVLSMSLPDPTKFWLYRTDLPIAEEPGGGLNGGAEAASLLAASEAQRAVGTASRNGRGKRWLAWSTDSGDLIIRHRRSPWFWLPGLLRGGWCEIGSRPQRSLAARPAARRRARRVGNAAAADTFEVLEVMGQHDAAARTAPAWVFRPRRGRQAQMTYSANDLRRLGDLLDSAQDAAEAGTKSNDRRGANSDAEAEAGVPPGASDHAPPHDRPPARPRSPRRGDEPPPGRR